MLAVCFFEFIVSFLSKMDDVESGTKPLEYGAAEATHRLTSSSSSSPPAESSGLHRVASLGLIAAGQRYVLKQWSHLRPWSVLVAPAHFTMPKLAEVGTRAYRNAIYFETNYLIVALCIFSFILYVFSSSSLLFFYK